MYSTISNILFISAVALRSSVAVGQIMPVIDFNFDASEVALNTPVVADDQGIPTVFVHGMGDSGSNPGMKSLCQSLQTKYPSAHFLCSNTADGTKSIFTKLDKQIDEFRQEIAADPKLANGFNAVGLSQGNLLLRGYIEKFNDPPVKTFVSICGPHAGIGTCPDNILYKLVCPIWKLAKYTSGIAFSDYWKDSKNKDEYLQKSPWLADINNERDTKNATYTTNMKSLTKLVLVEALEDSIVQPKESEFFGFWQWGSDSTIVGMRDTDGYKGDWIGLKTLDTSGRLDTYTFEGDHLRFNQSFWKDTILPYLDPSKGLKIEMK